jgi:hypothetical protein
LELLEYVPAAMIKDGQRVRHASGVYFQNIPINHVDGLAAFTYQDAEAQGYFKIDFLRNTLYKGIKDEQHLLRLLHTEPEWKLFLEPDVVEHLYQFGDHIKVLQIIQPKSIEDLAVCIALIRPGKKHLLREKRDVIDREIWKKSDAYYYKKSHAIAFAASIVLQLNLLVEKINDNG